MKGHRKSAGFTVVELLVSGFILVLLFAMVGNYFGQQARVNRSNLALAEVQDKVRLVMQLVTQDLQLGGANTYVDSTGTVVSTGTSISSCPSDGMVDTCLTASSSGVKDGFSTVYINTLRATTEACREVGYRFNGDVLQRADRHCAGSADLLDATADADSYSDLASNILAMDIEYKCSDGTVLSVYPDTLNCPPGASYLRSAVVTIVGRSDISIEGSASNSFATVSGQSVTCPTDFRCFALEQEVLAPNFKDR